MCRQTGVNVELSIFLLPYLALYAEILSCAGAVRLNIWKEGRVDREDCPDGNPTATLPPKPKPGRPPKRGRPAKCGKPAKASKKGRVGWRRAVAEVTRCSNGELRSMYMTQRFRTDELPLPTTALDHHKRQQGPLCFSYAIKPQWSQWSQLVFHTILHLVSEPLLGVQCASLAVFLLNSCEPMIYVRIGCCGYVNPASKRTG